MSRVSRALPLAAALVAACGDPSTGAAPPAAPTAPIASSSAIAAAPIAAVGSTSARVTPPRPHQLARRTTPRALYEKDRARCEGGDPGACRRVANRFSGVGVEAGCGVPRDRPYPALKRAPADAGEDELAYANAMRSACRLGDDDACALARVASRMPAGALSTRFSATRRSPDELGIWRFRTRSKPPEPEPGMPRRDDAKKLAERRAQCLADPSRCVAPDSVLFRQERAPKDGKLASEIVTLATEVCDATHDCDDVYVALDKARYSPAELAPIRDAFARTLTAACLDGECTCSAAMRYAPAEDPSRLDLAILGCENGEADGCAALAAAYEAGEGVPKDVGLAAELYELTCPPVRPEDGSDDYSPRACDHLAEAFSAGPYPGKDRPRALYYAEAACRHPGHEIDHAPCVRLGLLWAMKRTVTYSEGMNARLAQRAAYGFEPDFDHECDRPSVKSQCDALAATLRSVK
ncbi:MAG: hypothetical protein U0414_29560 [Polyangiaceae bacterium]